LNARQRFNRIMHFQPVDRPPVWSVEGVTEGAVRRWIKDGTFPEGMALEHVIKLEEPTIVRLDTDPLPAFVKQTVDENERWITTTDEYGFTVRTLKEQSVSPRVYYYVGACVRDRDDWQTLKKRYDPADPRRMPRAWGPDLWAHYDTCTSPVELRIDWGPGRGPKNGYTMGLEPFLDAVLSDPALVKEMFDFWAEFVIACARPWLEHVHFDYACFVEDGIAYKNSTLVSPSMYRDLWVPALRKVVDVLLSYGIDVIAHYTSGNICPLIPTLLDIGISLFFPLEAAAGMDALALRGEFGRDIRLIGNISRQALMDGPQAIDEEFERKALPLMADGGYVPAVDDMITPNITFQSYSYYIEKVRSFRC
jgi:hypothetical protein